jgi:hypothetical protein
VCYACSKLGPRACFFDSADSQLFIIAVSLVFLPNCFGQLRLNWEKRERKKETKKGFNPQPPDACAPSPPMLLLFIFLPYLVESRVHRL